MESERPVGFWKFGSEYSRRAPLATWSIEDGTRPSSSVATEANSGRYTEKACSAPR